MIAIAVSRSKKAVICRVKGDLDAFGVSSYREVTALVATEGRPVVIDLSGVAFIDGAGLGALVGTVRRCRDNDTEAAVCSPRPSVARALAAAGFDRVAAVAADVAEAIAGLHPPQRARDPVLA